MFDQIQALDSIPPYQGSHTESFRQAEINLHLKIPYPCIFNIKWKWLGNVWFAHLLDKDSTPCHVFPSVMNSIHSNVRDIVASPFWKEVGEGDPFAMALHLCVFANKYLYFFCNVPSPGRCCRPLGLRLSQGFQRKEPRNSWNKSSDFHSSGVHLTKVLSHEKKESPVIEPIAFADPDSAIVAVKDTAS